MSLAPQLGRHQVHIWYAGLDLPAGTLARLATSLSPAEQAQAAREQAPARQARFIARRGVLRGLLGRYLQCDPAALTFSYGAQGKPMLIGAPLELHFSLAHSAERAIYALSRCGPLGVDLEAIRPDFDFAPIVHSYFAPAEQAALGQLPAERRPALFFRLWACKEAWLKASSTGLSYPIEQLAIVLDPPHPPRLGLPTDHSLPPGWHLRELAPEAGYAAALALACERCALAQMPTFEYY